LSDDSSDKEEFFENVKNCIIKSNKEDYEKQEDTLNNAA
jgi:hypothetical protein